MQDTHTKNEADGTIETLTTQLQKRKTELDALEAELEREEAELEVIQEGLKGKCSIQFSRMLGTHIPRSTKTKRFLSNVRLSRSKRILHLGRLKSMRSNLRLI